MQKVQNKCLELKIAPKGEIKVVSVESLPPYHVLLCSYVQSGYLRESNLNANERKTAMRLNSRRPQST